MVIAVTRDSTYTYSAVLDPRMTKEVVLASIDTYLGVIEAERGKMEKLRKETVEDKVKATNLRIS